MCAVREGHHDVARLLLDAGADVHAQNRARIGETALHAAAENADAEMVVLLLRAGVDPRAEGWMRLTPVHPARDRKEPERGAILEMLLNPAARPVPLSNRKARRQAARAERPPQTGPDRPRNR